MPSERPPKREPLKASFSQLRSRMTATAAQPAETDVEWAAELLRFEMALRGRTDPRELLKRPSKLLKREPDDQTNQTISAVLDALAADCETRRGTDRRWLLLESVRRRVLRSTSAEVIARAVAGIPADSADEVTLALRRLYVEHDTQLETLSAPELRALIAASEWTGRHGFEVDELERLLARRNRVDEYERLVSRGVFGRQSEMQRLTAFFRSQADGGPTLERLDLYGPGGIGKSTLVAALALEVLRDDDEAVFVHLDFDRADLDPTRRAMLDLELLRQAGISTSGLDRELRDVRHRIRSQFADDRFLDVAMRQTEALEAAASTGSSAIVGALETLRESNRALLLIVDTYEQVEAGGGIYIGAFESWLNEVAALCGAPKVRVIVSGRTDPRGNRSIDDAASALAVGELERAGAVELLHSRGIEASAAETIFDTFGGNPLVLRLAAELVVKVGRDELQEIVRDAREGRVPADLVQGLLYGRFLRHIEAPANDYAHPGLVLPEITVEVIQHVLAPARGETADLRQAETIFEGLRRATWLVRESGDSLVQRRDLRQLMLRLMASDAERASSVQRVRELAIDWHSGRPGPGHRAAALYHRLMQVKQAGELAAFENVDFSEIAVWLRPHADDLPDLARNYVQARLLRGLGAEAALETLPDQSWSRYLAGDGVEPGEGDRLVQSSDPMIALTLWRRRPVRIDGQLPIFVLQALADTGEWEDPAREGALAVLPTLGTDARSNERLYWLTRLQLLRRRRISGLHAEQLRRVMGGDTAEQAALTAVAEALSSEQIIPNHVLENGSYASETRLYLVHRRFGYFQSFKPHLDALLVMQRDWARRMKRSPPWPTWAIEHARAICLRLLAAVGLSVQADPLGRLELPSVMRHDLLDAAQLRMNTLDRAPVDQVAPTFQSLRFRVRAPLDDDDNAIRLLRGITPEFHRPVRQALCEALTTEPQIRGFMTRLRPALTLCPHDFEPDAFASRAAHNPQTWFLALVQCADRARVMEPLLTEALHEAPDHPKLRRVSEAWTEWDRAICQGASSMWAQPTSELLNRGWGVRP